MGVNKEECARCGGNKEYEEGMCSLEKQLRVRRRRTRADE
jgi:hypothetical protein